MKKSNDEVGPSIQSKMKHHASKKINVAQSKPFVVEGLHEFKIKEFPSSTKHQLQKKNPIGAAVEKQNQRSLSLPGSKFHLDSQKKSSAGRNRTKFDLIDSKNLVIDWWRSDYKDLSINLGEKHWYDELSDLLPVGKSENKETLCVNSDVLAGTVYSVF